MIFLGIVGRLWSTLYIGGRKSAEVVTGGPYSMTRNPLYVFSTLAAAGVGAQMGSIVATIGFGAALRRGLPCRHPARGALPRSDVRRRNFGPMSPGCRVSSPSSRSIRRAIPASSIRGLLLTTLLDGLVFLVALPVFEMIDYAQQSGIVPVLFRCPEPHRMQSRHSQGVAQRSACGV